VSIKNWANNSPSTKRKRSHPAGYDLFIFGQPLCGRGSFSIPPKQFGGGKKGMVIDIIGQPGVQASSRAYYVLAFVANLLP
jgi:hypothetical protein